MKKYGIKHPFARLETEQKLKHITQAQKSLQHKYVCLECDKEMIPCQGLSKTWYFRHKFDGDELACVHKNITADKVDYFEKYENIDIFVNDMLAKNSNLESYKIINKTLYPLVNESRKIIIDVIDYRGLKTIDSRVKNAEKQGYSIILVTVHHIPFKRLITPNNYKIKPFTVIEFNTQIFPELFYSFEHQQGVVVYGCQSKNVQLWLQSNNAQYQRQVYAGNYAQTMNVKNYIEE